MTDVRFTHIGGPTTLIEFGGWRILTDPTFDAPGRTYKFGWGTSSVKTTGPGKPTIAVTATPCRHGPPGSHPIVGDVIGFALTWPGQAHGALWISGDTVLYDGVRQVADKVDVGTAILHLGGVRFPITGPLHYTMTAKDAVALVALLRLRTAIPVHYEGWSHFKQGRAPIEQALAAAGPTVHDRVRWTPIGEAVDLTV